MAAGRHSYQVTKVVPNQTVPDALGNVQVGSYIDFLTGDGNTGVIFVPDNLLNEQHVKNTLREAARKLDRISNLQEQFD
jgi:hypothetical protein